MKKFKYAKLRGRMTEKGITQAMLAVHLGISAQTVSKKLNGTYGLSQGDIIKICDLLDISVNDIGLFFYANNVSDV